MENLHSTVVNFLKPYLLDASVSGENMPFTMVTWAQSLDAKLAPSSNMRYPLSDWQTWYMAYYLRRISDAVLIGAQTAVIDDPSLSGDMGF